MEVRLQLVDSGAALPDELGSLREWLGGEPEFRGRVRIEESLPQTGQMGGGLGEVLAVAVASGGALTVLASSVSVWLEQRRSTVTVKIVHEDGRSQEISASGRAADSLMTKLDPGQHD